MPRKKKLPTNIRRHGPGFRAVVEIDHQRYRSPTMPTVEQAQQWMDTFRASLNRPADKPLHVTLGDALSLIEADLEQTRGRAATLAYYRNHARILFAGMGGRAARLDKIQQADVRRYMAERRAAGVSDSTIVGKELFILRRMRKLAADAGFVVGADPFAGMRMPKIRQRRFDALTRERVAELLQRMRAARQPQAAWHADLVELLFATGLRLSELARLTVADIDFEQRRINVDGKTDQRDQPFGASLVPVLQRLVAAAQPNGKLVRSHRTIEKLFPAWQKRLGEPRFSAHVMRHSYATTLAEMVGAHDLMALMGHHSLTQTSRYLHARDDRVRAALESLSPGQPEQQQHEPRR